MEKELEVTLVTGRTAKQGIGLVSGKNTEYYKENVALVQLSSEDMEKLKITEGDEVLITSEVGEVKLPCQEGKLPSGVIFMPYGPWSNRLIGVETGGTGMPDSKGITVEISRKGGGIN